MKKINWLLDEDRSLNIVKSEVTKLGDVVTQHFEITLANFDFCDVEIIRPDSNQNDQITKLRINIEEMAILYIEKMQPSPVELNIILGILKIASELTHVSEQTDAIARRAGNFINQSARQQSWEIPYIGHCASITIEMLKKAVDGLSQLDSRAAVNLGQMLEQVTEEYNFIISKLIDYMAKDPRSISSALDILYIAKSIESVANHANHISYHLINLISEYEKLNLIQLEPAT